MYDVRIYLNVCGEHAMSVSDNNTQLYMNTVNTNKRNIMYQQHCVSCRAAYRLVSEYWIK